VKITKDTVKKISGLSRLELSEDETSEFAGQLGRIIDYMDKLDRLDTSGVSPASRAAEMSNVFRKDEPGESLPPEKTLSNAPDRHKNHFKVPGIILDYES
jgi:aspartyl-tRNA(Asn)/glutamyl-tRNA(Gln) amidotransferase subunit C